MSSKRSSGSGLLDMIGVFLLVWCITFWVFDVQVSFRLEQVSSDLSTFEALRDAIDKSTNILDHTELEKQIDIDVPSNE